jgi:DNA replication ATP-dependent helicase Dna2
MDVSLLKRLTKAHPQAVSHLNTQYRMNEDIMFLCNTLIYEHRMVYGNEIVARARLDLLYCNRQRQGWIQDCLNVSRNVIFLNTDLLDDNITSDANDNTSNNINNEKIDNNSIVVNVNEVNIVYNLYQAFFLAGIKLDDIGIISPFLAQVKAIKERLQRQDNNNIKLNDNVSDGNQICDVSTVDKFQGRDKDLIIISTVKNKSKGSIGNLLRDWRRVNVAFTR